MVWQYYSLFQQLYLIKHLGIGALNNSSTNHAIKIDGSGPSNLLWGWYSKLGAGNFHHQIIASQNMWTIVNPENFWH